MNQKLTLKLDEKVIGKAKSFARKKNTSLSKLIETYLQFITSNELNDTAEITPLVKSISGENKSSGKTDAKKEYRKHVLKKYSGKNA